MKILSSLLPLAFFATVSNAVCDSIFGATVNNQCACFSGHTGDLCDTDEIGSCGPLPTVDPLKTGAVAEFMSADSLISGSALSFVVASPATQNRYFQTISLNNVPACSYPGPSYLKSFISDGICKDLFTGNFAITDVVDTCGFVSDLSEPGVLALTGNIHVTAIDQLSSLRGYPISRTTKSVLSLRLLLPTFVNVTTSNLNVFAPSSASFLAAVTYQEYDPATDTATIRLTTSLQWPYEVSNPSLTQRTNPAFNYTVSISELDCASDASSGDCLQETTLTISDITGSEACNFDGDYALSWEYGCRPNQNPCPVVGSPTLAANFTLESGDLCGAVSVEAHLTGNLLSYNAGFGELKTIYLAGERMYFKVVLSSDVTLETVSLNSLKLVQGQRTVLLVNQGEVGLGFQFSNENTGNPQQLGFSFVATYGDVGTSLFDSSVPDAVFPFTLEATLDVTYRTTFGSGRKRDAVQSQVSFSSTMVLDASGTKIGPGHAGNHVATAEKNTPKGFLAMIFA